MTFQIIQGDLFDPAHEFEALAQGVNTWGVMGAGIAPVFKNNWPKMFDSYADLCKRNGEALSGLLHAFHPLAEISEPEIDPATGSAVFYVPDSDPIIYNLFTQTAPGRGNARIEYLKTAAILMRQDAENQLLDRVGLPWIGAGIGGLERHNVQYILESVLDDSETEFILVQQEN